MRKISVILVMLALCLLGGLSFPAGEAFARGPACPSSWPEQAHEGFFTDAEGKEWFIIRSADSNGYVTVRAYAASDSYASGYVPNSPDQVCYLLARLAGETDDLTEPRQLEFSSEQEDPTDEHEDPTEARTPEPTLLSLLSRLSPADRQSAVLCLAQLAGNRTLAELNNDPEFLRQAIAHGCLTP